MMKILTWGVTAAVMICTSASVKAMTGGNKMKPIQTFKTALKFLGPKNTDPYGTGMIPPIFHSFPKEGVIVKVGIKNQSKISGRITKVIELEHLPKQAVVKLEIESPTQIQVGTTVTLDAIQSGIEAQGILEAL